jgi:hypothetical protein
MQQLFSSLPSQRHHRAGFALLCGGGGQHNGQERHSTDTETPFRKLPLDMFPAVCWTSGSGVNSRVLLRYPKPKGRNQRIDLVFVTRPAQQPKKHQWMTFFTSIDDTFTSVDDYCGTLMDGLGIINGLNGLFILNG